MALIFFEGFETIGTETGISNATTVTPRLRKRMRAENNLGDGLSSNMFLTLDAEESGFAWHMGDAGANFANRLIFDLPEDLQVLTGPTSPIITIGALVHIPEAATSFTLYRLNHTGNFDPNLRVVDSTDLQIRVGSNVVDSVSGELEPGFWHYIEWQVRADGTLGTRGTADVNEDITSHFDDPEAADISSILINNVQMFLPVWDSDETYTEGDQVRWRGIEYEAQDGGETNTNKEPGVEDSFWAAQGAEQSDTLDTVPFGTQFFFEDHPELIYTTTSFDSETSMSFTPSLTSSDPLPANGSQIVFGTQAQYGIQVNGISVRDENGVPTMSSGDFQTLQDIIFGTEAGDPDNFVAYDDIYVVSDQDGGLTDYLGPVKAVSLVPNNTLQDDWDVSASTSDHTDLISENGVNLSSFVLSENNSWIDEYEHESLIQGAPALAIKLEAEAQNSTAGDPELQLSIVLGVNENTTTKKIENNGDTEIINAFIVDPPGGGDWTLSNINNATIKIQIDSGFGA